VSYPAEPLREHPSTYYVQDLSNQDEITRLEIQDKMLTTSMGGVLPELDHPELLQRVLDVGCGTGGWLIETAKTYPTIEKLVGADISGKMMTFARGQIEATPLAERVEFRTMDALRILDFPHENFDLVNQRAGVSWLRTWEWSKILLEYQRVTRSGGIIRITEPNMVESNSPALTKLCDIAFEANYRSGRFFAARGDGATCELVRLMTQYGIQNVQTQVHTLIYQAGTEAGQYFYTDMLRMFRVMLPFLQKWASVPCDYEEIYQQALKEMQQPDFVATWTWLTAWGSKSHDEELMYLWKVR
jgi:ubiquinone/menaquinone biosynthesis C-methylase UbiE